MTNNFLFTTLLSCLFSICSLANALEYDGFLVQLKTNQPGRMSEFLNKNTITTFTYENLQIKKKAVFLVRGDIEQLQSQDWVDFIEPNYIIQANTRINDPLFEVSWGLENLGNNEPRRKGGRFPVPGKPGSDSNIYPAWEKTVGDHSIKIAIIDTGVDYTHPDLKSNIWTNIKESSGLPGVDDDGNGYIDDIHGYDFANNDGDPMDDFLHGTHVAGIIGAEHNSIGIAGVMGKVTIIPIKFMDEKGRGSIAQAIKAIQYAISTGAQIHNNSWGTNGRSQILYDLLATTKEKNILIVAAAGNSWLNNDFNPKYPTSFDLDNIISVAAYSAENRLTGFSCYGPKSVDLAAPGRNIMSTVPDSDYKVLSGTSMSAPYVSGALGLYLSLHPNAKALDVKEQLLKTTTFVKHLAGKVLTEGRMNIGEFVQ